MVDPPNFLNIIFPLNTSYFLYDTYKLVKFLFFLLSPPPHPSPPTKKKKKKNHRSLVPPLIEHTSSVSKHPSRTWFNQQEGSKN